jgi:hypothetical protein
MTEQQIGEWLLAYVHAKWAAHLDPREVARLGGLLGAELRDRVDALGADGEHLLNANATEVLKRLETLEREAMEEDAHGTKPAAVVRAGEEHAMDRRARGMRPTGNSAATPQRRPHRGNRRGRDRQR